MRIASPAWPWSPALHAAWQRRRAVAPRAASSLRSRTRRRLLAVHGLVIAALASVLVAQLLALRRMEAAFAEAERHESRTRLALRVVRAPLAGARPDAPGDAILAGLAEAARSRRELLDAQRAALGWSVGMLLAVASLGALAVFGICRSMDRLVESEKAAGIGRALAGAAHEINSHLQVMLGYLSLHRDHADRRRSGELALVLQETEQCKRVVEELVWRWGPALLGAAQLDDVADGQARPLTPGSGSPPSGSGGAGAGGGGSPARCGPAPRPR